MQMSTMGLGSARTIQSSASKLSTTRTTTTVKRAPAEDSNIQPCASNCQFYNNEKGYVRALRDILHSIGAVTNAHKI